MFKMLKQSMINLKPLRARLKEFAIQPNEIKKLMRTQVIKQIVLSKFGNKRLLNVLIVKRKLNQIEQVKNKENISTVMQSFINRILNRE